MTEPRCPSCLEGTQTMCLCGHRAARHRVIVAEGSSAFGPCDDCDCRGLRRAGSVIVHARGCPELETVEYRRVIARCLDTFQWATPDRADNRGELALSPDTDELILVVWAIDNDDPAADRLVPQEARFPFTPESAQHARQLIRNAIHAYVCHEVDEQLWFGIPGDRPFYPHREETTA